MTPLEMVVEIIGEAAADESVGKWEIDKFRKLAYNILIKTVSKGG